MEKIYLYNINIEDRSYVVRFIKRNVKYLRLQVRNAKDIYFIGRRVLTNEEMYKLVRDNEKKIIKYLSVKKIDFDKENQFVLFGKVYNRSDYTNKSLKELEINALKEIEVMYYDIMNKYNFKKCELYFRKMKSRWGVCYPKKYRIGLSTYLICVPKYLIEYVICHEFCHLVYANHSNKFYDELKKYIPNCKELRKELKEYTNVI